MRVGFVLVVSLLAGCGRPDVIEVPLSLPLLVSGVLGTLSGGSLPGAGAQVVQDLGDQGVNPDRVDSITVLSLDLVQITPLASDCQGLLGCDLSFIESLTIGVESPGLNASAIGEIGAPGPGSVRSVSMTPADTELKPYITSDSMSLVGTIAISARPLNDVQMQLDVVLRVDVKIF